MRISQPKGCIRSVVSPASDTDRIERSVIIKVPRERVWRAISNAEEFGTW